MSGVARCWGLWGCDAHLRLLKITALQPPSRCRLAAHRRVSAPKPFHFTNAAFCMRDLGFFEESPRGKSDDFLYRYKFLFFCLAPTRAPSYCLHRTSLYFLSDWIAPDRMLVVTHFRLFSTTRKRFLPLSPTEQKAEPPKNWGKKRKNI